MIHHTNGTHLYNKRLTLQYDTLLQNYHRFTSISRELREIWRGVRMESL